MRIAVDARPFEKNRTGIGRYLEGILTAWTGEFPTDEILLLSPRPVYLPATLEGRVRVLPPLARLAGTLWLQTAAPIEARRAGADIFFGPNAVVPLATSLPRIATIHDLTPLLFPEWHDLKQRLGMVPFLPAVVREATHLFCVSHATRRDLMRHFPEAGPKSSVVWNGLNALPKASAADNDTSTLGNGLPGDGYILYLGTREPRKNLSRLLDALEAIWDRRPDFPNFVVAGGSGWGMANFPDRVQSSRHATRIRLLGYVDPELTDRLVARATVLAYPSLYEGFGLPPLEAMAAGTPVVASSSSSLPEVTAGLALLPDPENTREIARALETAVDDTEFRRRARVLGPIHAGGFTWKRAVSAMRPIFEKAIAEGSR